MTDIDDYVTGHEDDVIEFNFDDFNSDIWKWHNQIEEDLRKEPYDMTLLCVNAVLNTVRDYIQDNTIIHNTYGLYDKIED